MVNETHSTSQPEPESLDRSVQDLVEGRSGGQASAGAMGSVGTAPPAGAHADPALTNEAATPGSGALPAVAPDDDVDAATG